MLLEYHHHFISRFQVNFRDWKNLPTRSGKLFFQIRAKAIWHSVKIGFAYVRSSLLPHHIVWSFQLFAFPLVHPFRVFHMLDSQGLLHSSRREYRPSRLYRRGLPPMERDSRRRYMDALSGLYFGGENPLKRNTNECLKKECPRTGWVVRNDNARVGCSSVKMWQSLRIAGWGKLRQSSSGYSW